MKTLTFVCTALLASSLACATTPTSIDPSRQRVVSYADLDLNKTADAETLYQRIRTAARDVCWVPGVLAAESAGQVKQCVKDTTRHAVARVNAPGLKNKVLE